MEPKPDDRAPKSERLAYYRYLISEGCEQDARNYAYHAMNNDLHLIDNYNPTVLPSASATAPQALSRQVNDIENVNMTGSAPQTTNVSNTTTNTGTLVALPLASHQDQIQPITTQQRVYQDSVEVRHYDDLKTESIERRGDFIIAIRKLRSKEVQTVDGMAVIVRPCGTLSHDEVRRQAMKFKFVPPTQYATGSRRWAHELPEEASARRWEERKLTLDHTVPTPFDMYEDLLALQHTLNNRNSREKEQVPFPLITKDEDLSKPWIMQPSKDARYLDPQFSGYVGDQMEWMSEEIKTKYGDTDYKPPPDDMRPPLGRPRWVNHHSFCESLDKWKDLSYEAQDHSPVIEPFLQYMRECALATKAGSFHPMLWSQILALGQPCPKMKPLAMRRQQASAAKIKPVVSRDHARRLDAAVPGMEVSTLQRPIDDHPFYYPPMETAPLFELPDDIDLAAYAKEVLIMKPEAVPGKRELCLLRNTELPGLIYQRTRNEAGIDDIDREIDGGMVCWDTEYDPDSEAYQSPLSVSEHSGAPHHLRIHQIGSYGQARWDAANLITRRANSPPGDPRPTKRHCSLLSSPYHFNFLDTAPRSRADGLDAAQVKSRSASHEVPEHVTNLRASVSSCVKNDMQIEYLAHIPQLPEYFSHFAAGTGWRVTNRQTGAQFVVSEEISSEECVSVRDIVRQVEEITKFQHMKDSFALGLITTRGSIAKQVARPTVSQGNTNRSTKTSKKGLANQYFNALKKEHDRYEMLINAARRRQAEVKIVRDEVQKAVEGRHATLSADLEARCKAQIICTDDVIHNATVFTEVQALPASEQTQLISSLLEAARRDLESQGQQNSMIAGRLEQVLKDLKPVMSLTCGLVEYLKKKAEESVDNPAAPFWLVYAMDEASRALRRNAADQSSRSTTSNVGAANIAERYTNATGASSAQDIEMTDAEEDGNHATMHQPTTNFSNTVDSDEISRTGRWTAPLFSMDDPLMRNPHRGQHSVDDSAQTIDTFRGLSIEDIAGPLLKWCSDRNISSAQLADLEYYKYNNILVRDEKGRKMCDTRNSPLYEHPVTGYYRDRFVRKANSWGLVDSEEAKRLGVPFDPSYEKRELTFNPFHNDEGYTLSKINFLRELARSDSDMKLHDAHAANLSRNSFLIGLSNKTPAQLAEEERQHWLNRVRVEEERAEALLQANFTVSYPSEDQVKPDDEIFTDHVQNLKNRDTEAGKPLQSDAYYQEQTREFLKIPVYTLKPSAADKMLDPLRGVPVAAVEAVNHIVEWNIFDFTHRYPDRRPGMMLWLDPGDAPTLYIDQWSHDDMLRPMHERVRDAQDYVRHVYRDPGIHVRELTEWEGDHHPLYNFPPRWRPERMSLRQPRRSHVDYDANNDSEEESTLETEIEIDDDLGPDSRMAEGE